MTHVTLCDQPGCHEQATRITHAEGRNTGTKTWYSCDAHVPTSGPAPVCSARRTDRGDGPCSEEPGRWKVVYRASSGRVMSETVGCFAHCLAEVDRAVAAGSMARADMEEVKP